MAKNNLSYLTIDESSAIKGVLMILIIIGHNHILAPIGGQLFNYLYSFHIYGFFILPFLYNRKISIEKKAILNGFIRLWAPYIIFFLLCYFIYHLVVIKDSIKMTEILYGLISADKITLKDITGFTFIWFLPAYYTMMLVMMLLNKRNILNSIIILFLIILLNYNLYFTIHKVFTTIPFAIVQGFYYFTFGFITKLLLDKIPKIQYLSSIIFLTFSLLFWENRITEAPYVLPITGFLLIYSIRKYISQLSIIILIGKYSLPIYLVHVIVYNILEVVLPKTILFGVLIFLLTLLFSMIIAYALIEIKFLQKIIFPKNWNDLKSLYPG